MTRSRSNSMEQFTEVNRYRIFTWMALRPMSAINRYNTRFLCAPDLIFNSSIEAKFISIEARRNETNRRLETLDRCQLLNTQFVRPMPIQLYRVCTNRSDLSTFGETEEFPTHRNFTLSTCPIMSPPLPLASSTIRGE